MAKLNTRDEQLLDLAADIAKSGNYFLQIDETTTPATLRVINKIQLRNPVASVDTPALISINITPSFPIKKVYSEYEFNVPYPESVVLSQELKYVEISNLSYGEERSVEAIAQIEENVKSFLRNILITESSFKASASIFGIQDSWKLGDRVRCIDAKKSCEITITIFSIIFNFDSETTQISGVCEIEYIKKDASS